MSNKILKHIKKVVIICMIVVLCSPYAVSAATTTGSSGSWLSNLFNRLNQVTEQLKIVENEQEKEASSKISLEKLYNYLDSLLIDESLSVEDLMEIMYDIKDRIVKIEVDDDKTTEEFKNDLLNIICDYIEDITGRKKIEVNTIRIMGKEAFITLLSNPAPGVYDEDMTDQEIEKEKKRRKEEHQRYLCENLEGYVEIIVDKLTNEIKLQLNLYNDIPAESGSGRFMENLGNAIKGIFQWFK